MFITCIHKDISTTEEGSSEDAEDTSQNIERRRRIKVRIDMVTSNDTSRISTYMKMNVLLKSIGIDNDIIIDFSVIMTFV